MAKKRLSEIQKARGIKIKIIGLGGGGSSIVAEMSQRLPGVGFIAADTDLVNLQRVKNDHLALFSFGSETTCGLGTGMNSGLGQKVAKEAQEEIKLLFKDVDLFILVACLGGGIGSGALPIFAQAAHDNNALGIGVFTMPFAFEGQKRQRLAQQSLKESSAHLDAQMILSNEKIFEVAGNQTSFSAALSLINQNLTKNLSALLEIIRQPSLINIDFSDLKAVLRGHDQLAFLNSVMAEGDKRLETALTEITHYDFYNSEPIPAQKLLLHIAGGADLKMSEVSIVSQEVKKINPGAQIIFGVDRKSSFRDKIRIVLLSIGSVKSESLKKKKPEVSSKKSSKKCSQKQKINKKKTVSKSPKKKTSETQIKKVKKVKRLNALDVKELKKKSEFQKTSQEKIWEIPAFLRRNPEK
jgi:cell division protein FtsZ